MQTAITKELQRACLAMHTAGALEATLCAPSERAGVDGARHACFICGAEDHISRMCPTRRRPKAESTDEKDKESEGAGGEAAGGAARPARSRSASEAAPSHYSAFSQLCLACGDTGHRFFDCQLLRRGRGGGNRRQGGGGGRRHRKRGGQRQGGGGGDQRQGGGRRRR
jgi:hypothetical protein